MYLKGLSFCVFVIATLFDGSDGVPRPCPQFLPVAVRLDSPRTPYHLKTLVKVKDDKENFIFGDSEKPLSELYPSDLLLSKVKESPIIYAPVNKPKNEQSDEQTQEPKLIQISESSKEESKITNRPPSPRPKKRRRLRPKEPRKIILSQNSNWALKTINDKPAAEVLMTDKASVARDLKDATESSVVAVKKLEDLKQ